MKNVSGSSPWETTFPVSYKRTRLGLSTSAFSSSIFSGENPPQPSQFSWASSIPSSSAILTSSLYLLIASFLVNTRSSRSGTQVIVLIYFVPRMFILLAATLRSFTSMEKSPLMLLLQFPIAELKPETVIPASSKALLTSSKASSVKFVVDAFTPLWSLSSRADHPSSLCALTCVLISLPASSLIPVIIMSFLRIFHIPNFRKGSVGPQSFKIIFFPGLLTEDIDNQKTIIKKYPFRGTITFL